MSESRGKKIEDHIENHTKDDLINVVGIARDMNFSIAMESLPATEMGVLRISTKKDESHKQILLSKNNSIEEHRTIVALLLAEYLLYNGPIIEKKFKIEVFFLREMRTFRMSRTMLLATRLAMPLSVIDKANDITFSHAEYARRSKLLTTFVNSTYKDTEVNNILNIIDNLEFAFSVLGSKNENSLSA